MAENKNREKGYQGFAADWSPHRGGSDFWEIRGVIHENRIVQAAYAFNISVRRIAAGVNSFQSVNIGLYDLLHAHCYCDRTTLRGIKTEEDQFCIDDELLACGGQAQMIRVSDAIGFRLRGENFGLDLRMGDLSRETWYGTDGRMFLTSPRRSRPAMYDCLLPHMKSVGRLYLNGTSVRVEGRACFERMWGAFPLRRSAVHWERFYLFMENGDELSLTEFPYGKWRAGLYLPMDEDAVAVDDFSLDAIDFLEVNDWRFASGWQLSLPQLAGGDQVYMVPIFNEQYCLPISRPVLGVFNRDGQRLGYALAELFPGARNELEHIKMNVFWGANTAEA